MELMRFERGVRDRFTVADLVQIIVSAFMIFGVYAGPTYTFPPLSMFILHFLALGAVFLLFTGGLVYLSEIVELKPIIKEAVFHSVIAYLIVVSMSIIIAAILQIQDYVTFATSLVTNPLSAFPNYFGSTMAVAALYAYPFAAFLDALKE